MMVLPRRSLLVGGAALSLMSRLKRATAATPIDVFLAAGQSNDVGSAEAADALLYSPIPSPGTAFAVAGDGSIVDGVDPVYPSLTGSAWPMFMRTYNELTGRIVCIVGCARGGSGQWVGQTDNTNGVWDIAAVDSRTPPAITRCQDAMTTLSGSGYTPTFKGVLWAQGEADATYINAGLESVWDYIGSFNAMRPAFINALGGKFFVFQTGNFSLNLDNSLSNYRAIRNAQIYCVNGDSNAFLAFAGAKDFPPAQSFTLMQDEGGAGSVHYTQHGYNRMGYVGAINVVQSGLV